MNKQDLRTYTIAVRANLNAIEATDLDELHLKRLEEIKRLTTHFIRRAK